MLPASLLAEWKGLGIDCQSTFEFLFSLSPCLPISPGAAVTKNFLRLVGRCMRSSASHLSESNSLLLCGYFLFLSFLFLSCSINHTTVLEAWSCLPAMAHVGPGHLDWAQSCLGDKYSPQPLGVTPKVPDESHSIKSYLVRRDFPTLWLIVSSSLFFLDM